MDTTTATRPVVTNAADPAVQDAPDLAGGPGPVPTPVLHLDGQRINLDGLPMLISIPRTAALLGISRSGAYRCAVTGDLPVTRLGRRVYVRTAALRALVAVP